MTTGNRLLALHGNLQKSIKVSLLGVRFGAARPESVPPWMFDPDISEWIKKEKRPNPPEITLSHIPSREA
jgi:hypothetical protein